MGCLNPTMKAICPLSPIYDPPLGQKLAFKAVMFQGMRSGDELVMTIKISGCLDEHDCHVDQHSCLNRDLNRLKRSAIEDPKNGNEISEVSRISFRIVVPGESSSDYSDDIQFASGENILFVGSFLGIIGLFIIIGLLIYLKRNK